MKNALKALSNELHNRYLTLERDIKAASNSFYDSYLDLQEQFLRFVAVSENISTSSGNTSGSILRNPQIRELFVSVIGLDKYIYEKMADYAKKVNEHKHKREKTITLDTIIKYVTIIYNAVSAYATYKGIACEPLNIADIEDSFNLFERENEALKQECNTLYTEISYLEDEGALKDQDIERVRNLLSSAELDKLSLEEQNAELQAQISILKSIKSNVIDKIDLLFERQRQAEETAKANYQMLLEAIRSKNKEAVPDSVKKSIAERNRIAALKRFISNAIHEYLWLGDNNEFKKEKKLSIILIVASIFSMLACTIVSCVLLKYYSTFTFLENIWLFLMLFVLKYTIKTKKCYLSSVYSNNSFERFYLDDDGVLRSSVYKKKYKFFLVVACIGFVLNAILAWVEKTSVPLLITILELSTLALVIFTVCKVTDFFSGYCHIRFSSLNKDKTEYISFVFDPQFNKSYTNEEYLDHYPCMSEDGE